METDSKGKFCRIPINEDLFKALDNRSAWLLGLFAADGCISKIGTISISQSGVAGLKLIEYLVDILGGKLNIHRIKTYAQDAFNISFTSETAKSFFEKYGIVNNKTNKYAYPENLPTEFFREYLRGYVDGDGSITTQTNCKGCSYLQASFVGTVEFVQRVSEIVPVKGFHIYRIRPRLSEIRWNGEKAVKFCAWLYGNELIYRYYKYDAYNDFIKDSDAKYFKYNKLRDKCLALLKKGVGVMSAAKEIGIPFQTVYKWAGTDREIGNFVKEIIESNHSFYAEKRQQLFSMLDRGIPVASISKELGISQGTLYEWKKSSRQFL